MIGPGTTAVVLQLLAGIVAAYGAWRCVELQRLAQDPRLRALAWFFGLFAVSVWLHAAWEIQLNDWMRGLDAGGANATLRGNGTLRAGSMHRPGFWGPSGSEAMTPLLFGHHIAMLASLLVGTVAFARSARSEGKQIHGTILLVPLLVVAIRGQFVPLALAIQTALTLYLAAKAMLNHMERRTPGALQVALGFGLFFAGHLLFFLAHQPGHGRQGIGDILSLVGILLLVQMLPRRT